MDKKWNLDIATPERTYSVTVPGSSFEEAVNRLDYQDGFVFFKDKVKANPPFEGAELMFNAVAIARSHVSAIIDRGMADDVPPSSIVEEV